MVSNFMAILLQHLCIKLGVVTGRDLAQAYFNYLIGVLRLRSAIGTLNEQDLEEVNRRLQG